MHRLSLAQQGLDQFGGTGAQLVGECNFNRGFRADAQPSGGDLAGRGPDPDRAAKANRRALQDAFDAVARDFPQFGNLRRRTLPAQGLRQGMRGSRRQGCRHGHLGWRQAVQVRGPGQAQRQRAGLVEHDGIDPRQTLQRGAGFDQQTGAEQFARGCGDHRWHGQPQGAGAGDDQHGGGNVDRGAKIAVGQHHPDAERGKRKQVNQRRIGPRGPVGQRGVAIARLFGHGDQIGHPPQRGVAPGGGDFHQQGAGQIHLTRCDLGVWPGPDRLAFASDQGAVNLAFAADDKAVHRDAATGADHHPLSHPKGCNGDGFFACQGNPDRARHLQRG